MLFNSRLTLCRLALYYGVLAIFICRVQAIRDIYVILKRQSCHDGLEECNRNKAPCISLICTDCAGLRPDIAYCCAKIDYIVKERCIIQALEDLDNNGMATGSASQLTTSPATLESTAMPKTSANNTNLSACGSTSSKLAACEIATPGFLTLPHFCGRSLFMFLVFHVLRSDVR